jgi:hypothetical protein
MMRRLIIMLGALVSTGALFTSPATGVSTGYKAIASSRVSGVQDGHTGYGPGWIALTFDTGGAPHGPITGYLFHAGVAHAVGNDHVDVSSYYTAPAASVRTPFAGGYAYGHFNGCTWSYLDARGKELYAAGALHGSGCTPPSHTTAIFCTAHSADRLCNDGHSVAGEPEAGVWKNSSAHLARIRAGGCDVWGNVGSAAIYHGRVAAKANLIAHVNSGTVQVRYVIKHGDVVMANLAGDGSPQLPYGIQWGFYPRGCLA